MTEAEIRWTTYVSKGLIGFSDEAIKVFIEGQANSVCKNLMIEPIYEEVKINPLRTLLLKHLKGGELESRTNFFEKRPIEYSNGSIIMDI